MVQLVPPKKWQGIVFMIICPCSLVSIYFSITNSTLLLRVLANAMLSAAVIFIIKDLQQLPHWVQSTLGVMVSLSRCTNPSTSSEGCCFKNSRKASFSCCLSAASKAIVVRSVCSVCRRFIFAKVFFIFYFNFLIHSIAGLIKYYYPYLYALTIN